MFLYAFIFFSIKNNKKYIRMIYSIWLIDFSLTGAFFSFIFVLKTKNECWRLRFFNELLSNTIDQVYT